jgi:GT2 family glycosyltransferase/SAM-dependent methyltransferase/glycosyltransferase involved in cell wall biosynthesis
MNSLNKIASEALAFDHERFLPATMDGNIALEHWHRYVFAAQFTTGKVVVDIACGEGYGSNYLAHSSKRVFGIDISDSVIESAKRRYAAANLSFLVGNCTRIPLEDASVDVVVSFETLEHHAEHQEMFLDIKRILRPKGLLIISTPDRKEYSDKTGYHNRFHVKELYVDDFRSLLLSHFHNVAFCGQQIVFGSAIECPSSISEIFRFAMDEGRAPTDATLAPLYWIGVASDGDVSNVTGSLLRDPRVGEEISQALGRDSLATHLIRVAALPDSPALQAALGEEWYANNNMDVIASGADPYAHWLKYGCADGRPPADDLAGLMVRLLAERERVLHGRVEDAHNALAKSQMSFAETIREREKLAAAQLEASRGEVARLEEELKEVLQASQVREGALRAEIARLRVRARYEVESVGRKASLRERELVDEIRAGRAAAAAELEAQRLLTERAVAAHLAEALHRAEELAALRKDYEQRLSDAERTFQERERIRKERQEEELAALREDCEQRLRDGERTFQQRERIDKERHEEELIVVRLMASQQAERCRSLAASLAELEHRERELNAKADDLYRRAQEDSRRFFEVLHTRDREAAQQLEAERGLSKQRLSEQMLRTEIREVELERQLDSLRSRLLATEKTWLWRVCAPFLRSRPLDEFERAPEVSDVPVQWNRSEAELPRDVIELLELDDREFIRSAYKVLLLREPDQGGFSNYLQKLRAGEGKLEVLRDLKNSLEGRSKASEFPRLSDRLKGLWWRQIPIVSSIARARNRKLALLGQLRSACAEVDGLRRSADRGVADLQKFLGFDAEQYLAVNEDVAQAAVNPYEHYVRYGYSEGRQTRAPRKATREGLKCDWFGKEQCPSRNDVAVDIIVPVFNGRDFLEPLFRSITANTRMPYRVIIVDDCSTDPAVPETLRNWATELSDVLVLRNSENLGFVGSVNKAVAHVKSAFFVLLNSDVEVPPGWLDRLIQPLLDDERVASATPFSNAATICSFPEMPADNALYLELSPITIDDAFSRVVASPHTISIPTGIGFCMALRTGVVSEIGMFDPIFGRGYGEENDWCMRAAAAGYRHVLACNLFVYHKHGGSFPTEEKQRLVEKNLKTLADRYPRYHSVIREHINLDPAKAIRELVRIKLAAELDGGVSLVVDHRLGGGANKYRESLVKSLVDSAKSVIELFVSAEDNGDLEFSVHSAGEQVRFSLPGVQGIKAFFDAIRIREIICNNLVGSPVPLSMVRELRTLAERNDLPMTIMVHDFHAICPSYTLIDSKGEYCGVPSEIRICQDCIGRIPKFIAQHMPDEVDMISWRTEWLGLLKCATEIRCFSESSRGIVGRAYPEVLEKCTVVPHRVDFRPSRIPVVPQGQIKCIGVVGGINYPKGRGVLEKLARYIEAKKLSYRVCVIGDLDTTVPGISSTGRYEAEHLPELTEGLGINVFLVPSIWPETFSYVTSELITLQLPIVCFDIGAPAERVRNYAKGRVLNSHEPEDILRCVDELTNAG